MAALSELSGAYLESAARLRVALEDAQGALARAGPEEKAALEERVRLLRQMLAEMRDLRQVTGQYYTGDRDGRYTTSTLKAPRTHSGKEDR